VSTLVKLAAEESPATGCWLCEAEAAIGTENRESVREVARRNAEANSLAACAAIACGSVEACGCGSQKWDAQEAVWERGRRSLKDVRGERGDFSGSVYTFSAMWRPSSLTWWRYDGKPRGGGVCLCRGQRSELAE
jgi:hypothetical protein